MSGLLPDVKRITDFNSGCTDADVVKNYYPTELYSAMEKMID